MFCIEGTGKWYYLGMTLGGLFGYILFQVIVPLLFLLSVLTFVWGTFLVFIAGSADEELAETGKTLMLYGVVWLVLMGLVWWVLQALVGAVGGL